MCKLLIFLSDLGLVLVILFCSETAGSRAIDKS